MRTRIPAKAAAAAFLLAVLVSLWAAAAAYARKQISISHSLPVTVRAVATALDCDNSPGPQITLEGGVIMDGLGLRLIFQNNVKGTHTRVEEVSQDISILPAGKTITIPKQPVRGGVGGNPFIWIQFIDGAGNALSGEMFLGRCVQEGFDIDGDLLAAVLAHAGVTVADCSNSPGPFITIDGGIRFTSGLTARFIFRNNDNPVGGPHEAEAFADVSLIPAGHSITFPKQPVRGGVGGNPHIWAQFLDGDGNAIGDRVYLGRCVQI